MKCALTILGVAASLSLATVASASVTYNFATSNTTLANGATYCSTYSTSCSASAQTVTVYSVQSRDSDGNFVTPATVNEGTTNHPNYVATENGLFTVTDSPNNFGKGIAPYDPTETGSNFTDQDGITDNVPGSTTNDNLLLLKLTNFAAGSTLSILMDAGVSGDSFNVFTSTGSSTPTSLSGMSSRGTFNVDESGSILSNGSSQPTTPQVLNLTIPNLGPGVTGWIAIQADCHYLLLESLTSNTPGVPEPRFYGLLLTAFLGLAGVVYNKRRNAQANS